MTVITPAASDTREPQMMRESMSRPSRSVPSGYFHVPPSCHTGGLKRFRRDWSCGSAGLRSGARTASSMKTAMMPSETSGSLRPPDAGAVETPISGRAMARPVGSAGMPDAGVDDGIEAVDAEVHHGHDDGGGQHDRLDHGEVPRADALVGEPSDAGPREDRLHHDGGGDEDREVDAGEGHHGNERVLERVAPDDAVFHHALDARQLDVLGIQHLEHRRA